MPTTYLEAIREGIWEEMERDPAVFLLGEDIGVYGGAFKVTAGFLERFGERRGGDTPIAESAIVGAAIGASLMGLRPVAEIQFSDFITCGYDQIVSFAAKCRYRWGAGVPIGIPAKSGGDVYEYAGLEDHRALERLRCQRADQIGDSGRRSRSFF